MITKEQLLAAARDAAAANASRPLTKAFLEAVAAELASGEPGWWSSAREAWAERPLVDPERALRLLWAALHFEALGGHPVLRPYLPSCSGAASPALAGAVRQFLAAPPAGLRLSLQRTLVLFSPFWCSQWLEPARLFFQRRQLPFHVVDLASAGGLSACADLLVKSPGFDSELVEARVGLARPALDLRRDDDARWLVACCLPDDIESISLAAFGARRLRELRALDENAVQIADCPPELAPAFVAKNIPPQEGTGLLLYGWGAFDDLGADQRRRAMQATAQVLGAWGDRGLWVCAEKRAGDDNIHDVTVYRLRGDRVTGQSFKIVRLWSTKAEDFLDPSANAAFLA